MLHRIVGTAIASPRRMDQELIELEKRYWEAIRTRDGAAATRLSDARCLVVGPQGIGKLDREALAGLVENAPYELKRFRLDDVAVIAYKVSEEMLVDGELKKLDAFDAHTETIAEK